MHNCHKIATELFRESACQVDGAAVERSINASIQRCAENSHSSCIHQLVGRTHEFGHNRNGPVAGIPSVATQRTSGFCGICASGCRHLHLRRANISRCVGNTGTQCGMAGRLHHDSNQSCISWPNNPNLDPFKLHLRQNRFLNAYLVTVEPAAECVRLDRDVEIIVTPLKRKADALATVQIRILKNQPIEWTQFNNLPHNSILMHPNDTLGDNEWIFIQNLDFDTVRINSERELIGAYFRVEYRANVPHGCIVIARDMRDYLGLAPCSIVRCFTYIRHDSKTKKKINVLCKDATIDKALLKTALAGNFELTFLDWFHLQLKSQKLIAVHDGMIISLPSILKPCKLSFPALDKKSTKSVDPLQAPHYIIVNEKSMNEIEIDVEFKSDLKIDIVPPFKLTSTRFKGFDKFFDSCINFIKQSLLLKSIFNLGVKCKLSLIIALGGLLIYGGSGSGKTTVAKAVGEFFAKSEHLCIYLIIQVTININCSALKNLPFGKIKERLEAESLKALWHSPSILIFDDLDLLIPAEREVTKI